MTRHNSCRVSPFGHPRIQARLAAPRGISQPPTSFIGSRCQGIHHAPLNTYKHKNQSVKNKTNKLHGERNHVPSTRCSQPLSTNQGPHPTTKMRRQHNNVLPQDPTVCLAATTPTKAREAVHCRKLHQPATHYRHRQLSSPNREPPTDVRHEGIRCSLERR